MCRDLYANLHRYVKIGKAYGQPIRASNGLGQGDSAALYAALGMVSAQFYMLDDLHPAIRKGSCVDDRNLRGPFDELLSAFADVQEFDRLAGHFTNAEKIAVTATHPKQLTKLAKHNFGTQEQPVFQKPFWPTYSLASRSP